MCDILLLPGQRWEARLDNSDLLSWHASARPDKRAVLSLGSGEALSYAALDDLVARASGWLGGRAGERVAFLGRNSIEMLVLAYAAGRAGAIFVPLNFRLALAEITALLADCAPALIVADDEFMAAVPQAVNTASFRAALAFHEPAQPVRPADDAPLVLLYTSGTTGQPKGVIVTARNALYAALNFALVGEVGAQAVCFSDLPLFHTIGLIAVARTTLLLGGTLVLSDRFVPQRTLGALGEDAIGITHYFAVPVMAAALAAEPSFDAKALKRLHAIFVGGAAPAPQLVERFLGFGVRLVNGYGMSEAGTAIHVPIDSETVRQTAGAIGLPAPLIEVRLVADGRDVPVGEVGEIWLRGPSVTPGYWRRPADTAAAFSDGWFRSGDLAERDARGHYRIVDRLKDMFVSGGENVYPAEVEAALLGHPDVADAAVVGAADPRWGESGVAFVVARAGTAVDAAALAAFLAGRIARFKCPSRYVSASAIPRSPAGKILKPLLRQQLERG